MTRSGSSLLFGLMLWLTALGGRTLAAPEASPASPGDDARDVLVLLRAAPPHYRPDGAYGDAYDDTMGRGARRRIAVRLAQTHGLTLVTDWPMPLLGLDCYVMAARAGHTAAEEAALLARDPGVAWSEPMHVYRGEGGR